MYSYLELTSAARVVAALKLLGFSFQFPPMKGLRPSLTFIHEVLSSIISFEMVRSHWNLQD